MADTVRDKLRSELQAVMTAASIAWPLRDTVNDDEMPDAGSGYVTLTFAGGNETPAWFAGPGNNGWREYQIFYVDLVAPAGSGAAAGEDYARKIRDGFRNRRFATSDGLSCRVLAANPLGGGQDDRSVWRESVALELRVFNIG